MRTTFIDTSYLLALAFRRDEHHDNAVRIEQAYTGLLVTTEFVLLELSDAMCQSAFRSIAHSIYERLTDDPSVTIVSASSSLIQQGRKLYDSRPDKDWSLTDCISFVVMHERGITEALTADHHFDQAGFKALLR